MSIPDDLFHRAEALAAELGRSRSQVYRDALAEYLQRRDEQAITASYDAVVAEVGREVDPWVTETSRRTFERNEW